LVFSFLVAAATAGVPIILMHGMGDFANNPMGMIPIRNDIRKHFNGSTYVTNIPLAKGDMEDQMSEFLMVMNKEVTAFAAHVRADPKLAQGFNAIGLSQGNLIIRGYVERFNDPPVVNWLSVHGPLVGVIGFPHCNFSSEICKLFDEFLGGIAYTSLAQGILAQANYLRDPLRIAEFYKNTNFLPDLDNEVTVNATYKENFSKLTKLVLVKALEDTMVVPNDSEWFGYYADGSTKTMLSMKQTKWYTQDLFGLQTLDQAGKIFFETTPGDHLQFTTTWLLAQIDKYF